MLAPQDASHTMIITVLLPLLPLPLMQGLHDLPQRLHAAQGASVSANPL
jgi:hypothetical protein